MPHLYDLLDNLQIKGLLGLSPFVACHYKRVNFTQHKEEIIPFNLGGICGSLAPFTGKKP
tara:strand:+ start:224 stop:403 length:180 start_codon:yes stop_codon:yes gene_type:complete